MSLIFLVGPRGSGKSSAGAALARSLNLPFYDTDRLVEEQAGESIADMVAREGWESFRTRESAALFKTAELKQGVVSCGGGIVLRSKNREFLRMHGFVIWLHAPLETLWSRLSFNPNSAQRPALTDNDPKTELEETLKLREPLYAEVAHRQVNAGRPLQAVVKDMREAVRHSGIPDFFVS